MVQAQAVTSKQRQVQQMGEPGAYRQHPATTHMVDSECWRLQKVLSREHIESYTNQPVPRPPDT